jgi:hypothetical protein
MDIDLTAQDLILAAHHAALIEGVKSYQLSKNAVRNNRISNQGDFAIHYAGMLGEVAVAKAIGAPLRTDLTIGGDGNVDMIYCGQTIQIKTSTHSTTPPPRFIIFNSVEEFVTDWAVSCSIQGASKVRIHGFVSKRKFAANIATYDFGYGIRYCMDEKHLSPINRLNEAINGVKNG